MQQRVIIISLVIVIITLLYNMGKFNIYENFTPTRVELNKTQMTPYLYSTVYPGIYSRFGTQATCTGTGSSVVDMTTFSDSATIQRLNALDISLNVLVTSTQLTTYNLIVGAVDAYGELDLFNTYQIQMPTNITNTIKIKNNINTTAHICGYWNFICVANIYNPISTPQQLTIAISQTNQDGTPHPVSLPQYNSQTMAFKNNYLPGIIPHITLPVTVVNNYHAPLCPNVVGDIIYNVAPGNTATTGTVSGSQITISNLDKSGPNPFANVNQKIGSIASSSVDSSIATITVDTTQLSTKDSTNNINYFQVSSVFIGLT